MAELFSILIIALRISMVIGGVLAIFALLSGKGPRASSREIKIVLMAVVGLLAFIALVLVAATAWRK